MNSSRVSGSELAFTESMFKLTYKMDSTTKNITYKLWWHKDPAQLTHSERFSVSLIVANDSEHAANRNIAYKINLKGYPDVNYQIGETGYLENDPEVLAVDCAVADIYNTAMDANQVKLSVASRSANTLTPLLLTNSANATESGTQTVYKSKLGFNAYDKTLKIIPPSGSTSTDEVVNISGNAATSTHATSADSATNANGVHQQYTGTDKIRPLLLGNKEGNTGTSAYDGPTLYTNYLWANPSTGELTSPQFNGTLNGKAKSLNSTCVYLPSSLGKAGWKKVAEWTNDSMNGYYNLAITLLVTGGVTSIQYGDCFLKISCFGNRTSDDVTNVAIVLTAILSIRTTNITTFIPSNFKLTYTKNGKDMVYKLWVQHTETNKDKNESYGFTILNAVETGSGRNFINDINLLSNGTFSEGDDGYTRDGEVVATGSTNCGTGTIANATAGNAASATTSTQTRQALTSSNNNRPLLLSSSTDTSDTTANLNGTVQRTNKIYANASTGELTASRFVGDLNGIADSAGTADIADEASKILHTYSDSNYDRPLLLANINNVTTTTGPTKSPLYCNKIHANTFNGYLTAKRFIGPLVGTVSSAMYLKNNQDVLYESTTNTSSFTLSGLFTDWSAVMIFLPENGQQALRERMVSLCR